MNRTIIAAAALAMGLATTPALLSVTPAGAATTAGCAGLRATIVGTSGDDVLTGTPGADVIAGLGGNDSIDSLGGRDTICGGGGDDRLVSHAQQTVFDGGPGDDTEMATSAAIRYLPESGTNTLTAHRLGRLVVDFSRVSSPVEVDLRAGTMTFGGSSTTLDVPPYLSSAITGSRYDDTIQGGPGEDRLHGGPGSDALAGRGGDDRFIAGTGVDTVRGGGGDDFITYSGADRAYGGPGDDGLAGDLQPGRPVHGGPGVNSIVLLLQGKHRHVLIDLAKRRVVIDGTVSRLLGDFERAVASGAHVGSFTVLGTREDNLLSAASPAVVRGRGGDDMLVTGNGPDVLDGGAGHDRGGASGGRDTCISIEASYSTSGDTGCERTR